MSFGNDVARIAAQINQTIDQVQRGITIEVFNSVIDNTRVDTGRAKGNWQTTVTTPASGSTDATDKIGSATKAAMVSAIKPKSLMIITNNLPYIGKLEELDGMVGKTIARIGRIIRERAAG